MEKFKLKGYVIEGLPELEIEAENKEKAKDIYEDKYYNNEIEEIEDEIEVIFEDDEDVEEDFSNSCKIFNLKEEDMPNEVLDDVEHIKYYEKMGYECLGGVSDESRIMKFKRRVDKEQKRL